MPRNPLKTFRRKSSGNVLDVQAEEPNTTAPTTSSSSSSFRVLERPSNPGLEKSGTTRPRASQGQNAARSVENLGLGTHSAGTTHSGLSGYAQGYDTSGSSARYSSTSTLPSSFDVDADPENNELYPVRKQAQPMPEPPAPTFASKAGRAFSFGLKSHRNSVSAPNVSTPPPPVPFRSITGTASQPASPPAASRRNDSFSRDRAMTTSSYASTAKPPQLDQADFGGSGDFDNMFENLDNGRPKNKSQIPPVPSAHNFSQARTGSPFPPRASSRQEDEGPVQLDRPQLEDSRRYSWDSRKSSEQLISAPSSNVASPSSEHFPESAPLPGFSAVRGYQAIPNHYASPEPADTRSSPTSHSGFLSAQPQRSRDASSEQQTNEERAVWRSELRRPTGERDNQIMTRPSDSDLRGTSQNSIRRMDASPTSSQRLSPVTVRQTPASHEPKTSPNATPRPRKAELETEDDSLFDDSPAGPAVRAINPAKQRAQPDTPKRMTKAQFEMAQRHSQMAVSKDDEDDEKSVGSDGEGLDEEDDGDRARQMAAQRRKQEATMSVYRQQMKKVTGGHISDLPSQAGRPSFDRSPNSGLGSSMSSMTLGAPLAEDEDDDVPLGVLQAHGFPNKNRPPMHLPGASPGYAGSVAGNGLGENVPAFARRLPMDPYFGAGLVNAPQRESLAFGQGGGGSVYGGGSGSVYGGASPHQGVPGGLVGVIAGEERAKAARRGSPNPATGGYGPIPLPSGMQQQQPQMPQFARTTSMGSLYAPQMAMGPGGYMPQNGMLPGMPGMSPGEQANMTAQQQIAQLMEMQTHMMQQMMALQAGNMAMPMPGFSLPQSPSMGSLMNGGQSFAPQMTAQRPGSSYAPSIGAGRAMSMTNLSANWANPEHMQQQRSNTMGSSAALNKPNLAGSVYGMNLTANGPGQGYTPSIAPSERSNVGMPSRYRPVSTMDGQENQAQAGAGYSGSMAPPGPSPLMQASGNEQGTQAKSTIRVIEKPKGAPRTLGSFFGRQAKPADDEEDEDEGWAEMARKREEMRSKRATKMKTANGPALSDLVTGLE